jgi:hypothetical protein
MCWTELTVQMEGWGGMALTACRGDREGQGEEALATQLRIWTDTEEGGHSSHFFYMYACFSGMTTIHIWQCSREPFAVLFHVPCRHERNYFSSCALYGHKMSLTFEKLKVWKGNAVGYIRIWMATWTGFIILMTPSDSWSSLCAQLVEGCDHNLTMVQFAWRELQEPQQSAT